MHKPEWLRRVYSQGDIDEINLLMKDLKLNTVCREASCPNIGECYRKHTATFLVMGANCTRRCRFCNVSKLPPTPLDPEEPDNVAAACRQMGLRHAVITSVTRDDLPDGGAAHFAAIVRALRGAGIPTIELLIPDLRGNEEALAVILREKPDILGHNVETVPELYAEVRPQADYERSLRILAATKELDPARLTKTGIMVGLGETEDQLRAVFDDLAAVGCDILTVGQYLQPSKLHLEVREYVTPERFERLGELAERAGIRYAFSAPLVRSSYRAAEALEALQTETRK